jgi:hypothetical protein
MIRWWKFNLVYEDDGAIVTFERLEGRTNRVERHPGRLRRLCRMVKVTSTQTAQIRVSPDASFVAFGVGVEQDGETRDGQLLPVKPNLRIVSHTFGYDSEIKIRRVSVIFPQKGCPHGPPQKPGNLSVPGRG